MEPNEFGFDSWQEVLDVLERSGIIEEHPELHKAWEVAFETHDIDFLEQLLTRDPWIVEEANKRVAKCPFFQPKRDEFYIIQGLLNLGTIKPFSAPVGLAPLDLTRGLSIFGEIGSGKTYPILRLIDQVLSVPRKKGNYGGKAQ